MKRVETYQKNADDCRKLAAKMPPAHREQLLDMARQWEEIAEERERSLKLLGDEPPSI